MSIGKKIKDAIEKSGLPIRQVASELEISEQNLHRLFKRESVETKYLEGLCDLLDIPVTYFFGRKYQDSNKIKIKSGSDKVATLEEKLKTCQSENKQLREKNKQLETQTFSLKGKLSAQKKALNKLEADNKPAKSTVKKKNTRTK